jgi:hypothetical protein
MPKKKYLIRKILRRMTEKNQKTSDKYDVMEGYASNKLLEISR